MIDVDAIAAQVKQNCNISDARYWGYYSPCGLLLRLRDLYKVEHGLKPWDKISHKAVGSWIDIRESLWQERESQEFQEIEIEGTGYGAFEVSGINEVLLEQGLFYGAGYGNMLKPVFVLAELSERIVKGKYNIYITGRELARDLSTSPAMIQGHTIIARKETARMFLWGKFEEMKSRKCAGSLHHAFSEYGISGDFDDTTLEGPFSRLVQEELSSYVYHELGEASQRRILGRWWKQLLLNIPHSRAELFVRSLKDVLSDTCRSGMISYIVEKKKAGSLSFYVSLLSGFRKMIFPDMLPAYEAFRKTNNWDIIERARGEGYKKAVDYVRSLKDMFDKDKVSSKEIEQELMTHFKI